jgi:formate hydrogenlyase subunit 3/multisubunit Na+/H+ antiporter MnhD subunit
MQSVCTAVFTISGVRLAIGLTAFAMAGSVAAPIHWFHQDAIRIPMLGLAAVGAIADLLVLAWMRHLRTQPAAQWRLRKKSTREKHSQRLQVAVAILTLLLVGLETWTHGIMLRRAHAHAAVQAHVRSITS